MPTHHSLLSPSGASRWLACPPSARLEEDFPESSNDAADEGTLAHALAELHLLNMLKKIKSVVYNSELKKIKNNKFFNNEMNGFAMDYAQFVTEKFFVLKEASIFVEEKIDLSEYVPEGFGTVDNIIIADYILDVTDLKYGKGVKVEAPENKQMMLYALGALKKYGLLYHIKQVRMTIYQPRLDNYSSFEMDAEMLLAWGEDFVKPKAIEAFEGKGTRAPGDHCRFCKARNTCKALADFNLDLAKYAFEDAEKLTDQDIAGILEKAANFKTWLTGIQTYALQEAVLNGRKWPGFKLVSGKSNRKYTDPLKIIDALKAAKIKNDLFLTAPELVGITTLEKNIGKSEVDKLCGDFIVKPPGAATLVPSWDKRPELNGTEAAIAAFEDIN